MFFSVARLRRFLPLLLLPGVYSRYDTLFTSSVTYCEPPQSILIQQFDIAYIAKNQSIFFNVSAASVEPNVNVSANVFLNVYGMHPLNFTINLCSILKGALCPLPMYNFTGSDTIRLPSKLGVASRIPKIAYKIPDLEAFAQLTLVEVGTSNVKACIQTTLSNGWSAYQPAVAWATGGCVLVALLSTIWLSLDPDSLAPCRFLDLLYLLQVIACSGLLSLNYPSVYRAFTLNFSWALGLFYSSHMQDSINKLRHHTGGSLANDPVGSAVGLVNRKLSPYNVSGAFRASFTAILSAASSLLPKAHHLSRIALTPSVNSTSTPYTPPSVLAVQGVATVTTASPNVLQAGVPIYVNSIGIATANAFMTIFFTTLILIAIATALFGLGYAALFVVKRAGRGDPERLRDAIRDYPTFVRQWAFRLCLVASTPILVFGFCQWTLKDSWLTILFSVILVTIILGAIAVPTILTLRAFQQTPIDIHYSQRSWFARVLCNQYRQPRYYFFLPLLFATLSRALIIAFAKSRAVVQVSLLLSVELFVLLAHLVLRPSHTRGGDVLATYLALSRFIAMSLTVAFLEILALKPIPRVAIGIVIALVFSLSLLVMLVNQVLLVATAVVAIIRRQFERKSDDPLTSSVRGSEKEKSLEQAGADLEKCSRTDTKTDIDPTRPRNPTPAQNVPLDPDVLQSYPPTPSNRSSLAPHLSLASASTSLGSLVLSGRYRWSSASYASWRPESTGIESDDSVSSVAPSRASSPRSASFVTNPSLA